VGKKEVRAASKIQRRGFSPVSSGGKGSIRIGEFHQWEEERHYCRDWYRGRKHPYLVDRTENISKE